jgi:ABC-type antimicrobial peptide transport system permease subunit
MVGVYGVMSYAVADRTREPAVRLAIGAEPGRILSLVLRRSIRLVVAGAAIGIVLAVVVGRFLSTMLFGVSSTDPLTFAAVTVRLLVVAIVASCRRAVRRASIRSARCASNDCRSVTPAHRTITAISCEGAPRPQAFLPRTRTK